MDIVVNTQPGPKMGDGPLPIRGTHFDSQKSFGTPTLAAQF